MRQEQGESERRSLAMSSTSPAEDIGYVVGEMIGTELCLGVARRPHPRPRSPAEPDPDLAQDLFQDVNNPGRVRDSR
jgi:hypothetical protein